MSAQLEQQLFLQARAGDYDAFEQLQAQLEAPIRRFVRRLIGVHDAEDDIVQDVFISLYYHMDRVAPVENLRPYVFRIARNQCYDELRDQGRYDMVSIDDEQQNTWVSFTTAEDINSQPDELAHWLLLNLEVREAIDKLPELQREALILYSEENLSYAEIAVVMNVTIGTVKSRLHHAKRTLRQLLRPETLLALETDLLEMEPKLEPEGVPNV